MIFKARGYLLAAFAATALAADRAAAIDPQQTGDYNPGYANPAYLNPSYSNPGLGIPSTSIPGARDRVQPILIPDPNRIAMPDNTLLGAGGTNLRVSPISSVVPGVPGIPGVPQQTSQPRWRLGVYSKDTDAGVRIVQVLSGSAASRAGLEADDVIVAVNGYQVGFVNGQLFDCASEFERGATPEGWVRVLVQNHRNSRLMTMPIQLESRLSSISGSIVLNDRLASLPADAYVTVELQEILRPGAPAVTLSRQVLNRPRQFPIPFQIDFDPQQIDTRRSYVVTGRVQTPLETLYAPTSLVPVLTPGRPTTVNLAFDRVAANPGAPIGPYGQGVTLDQVVQMFQQYLGREPTRSELATWQVDLQRGAQLADVRSDILGQNQFFNQCDRDERVYIDRLHELVLGRRPTPEEVDYWMSRYNQSNGIRSNVAREFLAAVGNPN
jgi:uncharacterized lipoprotein YbaY